MGNPKLTHTTGPQTLLAEPLRGGGWGKVGEGGGIAANETCPRLPLNRRESIESEGGILDVGKGKPRGDLNVGLGSRSLPTPKMATAKKCMTSTEGLGRSPESSEMGPALYQPPRRR